MILITKKERNNIEKLIKKKYQNKGNNIEKLIKKNYQNKYSVNIVNV